MKSDHVVIPAMTQRTITPGITPKELKATGIERTPRPIWVFIIRTEVPNHPTYGNKKRLAIDDKKKGGKQQKQQQ
jgi:hypothetical protein